MTNTITIIGAPGSGKNHIISLLKNKLGKVTAVSKTDRKVKALAKDLGL
jgi:dephospho-CoA kinase